MWSDHVPADRCRTYLLCKQGISPGWAKKRLARWGYRRHARLVLLLPNRTVYLHRTRGLSYRPHELRISQEIREKRTCGKCIPSRYICYDDRYRDVCV